MIALYKAIFILCASHITHFSHNTREVTYMDYKILATVFAAVFIAATGISVLAGGLISQYGGKKTRTTSPVSALY